MSQQINLFDPGLLRRREWLNLLHLAVVSLALLVAIGGWGAWERSKLGALEAEDHAVAPQLKVFQDQIVAIGKQLSEVKPDARLETELVAARNLLSVRDEVVAALKKGIGAESPSFAEYLRGFARQTPGGLWLTGLIIGEGGASMEIRGRMTDTATLPEYIHRLNSEKAFQGRAFAALTVSAGQPVTPAAATPTATPAVPVSPAATASPAPYHEFTLTPVVAVNPSEGKR